VGNTRNVSPFESNRDKSFSSFLNPSRVSCAEPAEIRFELQRICGASYLPLWRAKSRGNSARGRSGSGKGAFAFAAVRQILSGGLGALERVNQASRVVMNARQPYRRTTMSPFVVTLWLINLLLDTSGQLAFKAATADSASSDGASRWLAILRRPWVWIGVACYVVEFFTWLAFLTVVPLAHGVLLAAASVVTVMLGGRWLFGEALHPLRVVGIMLIAVGVALVGVGAA
jgi:multidrug transporter EmrE-like cation transporter